MAKKPDPKVGVGVLICKEGTVLVGRRKGSVGSQTFALPGGHLDFVGFLTSTGRAGRLENLLGRGQRAPIPSVEQIIGLLTDLTGETWEECAVREVEEETGLHIHNIKFLWVTNTVMLEGPRPSHYVTIFMKCELKDAQEEPQNLEPEKCEAWTWEKWPNLPKPIFRPLQTLIDSKIDPFPK